MPQQTYLTIAGTGIAAAIWPGSRFARRTAARIGRSGAGRGTTATPTPPPGGCFPAAGPPLLWAREIGQGYSGFAVCDGRAYTQSQSLYEQSVLCLDADTGRTIWSYSYGWPYDGGGLYPGPRSTPTVSGGQIFFASPQGLVGCLTADAAGWSGRSTSTRNSADAAPTSAIPARRWSWTVW